MARQAVGFIKKYKQYLILQKEQARTETTNLCIFTSMNNILLASKRSLAVEYWWEDGTLKFTIM